MYCPKCTCEYSGWAEKCPICKTTLLAGKPEVTNVESTPIDYADLIDAVRETEGALTFKMVATDVATKRGRRFPYIGRGYAWTKQMEGTCDNCTATLTTTDVGRDRKWTFPYFGYGFAWEREMQGSVGGNTLTLKAENVIRETKMGFPYAGYGRAWVQSMSGKCGQELEATLTITEVQKRRKVGFPYFGFGYAWVSAGDLTLKLAE